MVLTPSFAGRSAGQLPVTPQQRPSTSSAHIFHSSLLATFCPAGLFLTSGSSTGFGAGCLCGLLFRNGLAAGVFGLFSAP